MNELDGGKKEYTGNNLASEMLEIPESGRMTRTEKKTPFHGDESHNSVWMTCRISSMQNQHRGSFKWGKVEIVEAKEKWQQFPVFQCHVLLVGFFFPLLIQAEFFVLALSLNLEHFAQTSLGSRYL